MPSQCIRLSLRFKELGEDSYLDNSTEEMEGK